MSEAEEQAAKWRIVEEYKAAKQQLAAIDQTADEYAECLTTIITLLRRGGHYPTQNPSIPSDRLSGYPSAEQIEQLLADRDAAKNKLARAKAKLEALGLDLH